MVETADMVLEVLDARDPLGCRCLQVRGRGGGRGGGAGHVGDMYYILLIEQSTHGGIVQCLGCESVI